MNKHSYQIRVSTIKFILPSIIQILFKSALAVLLLSYQAFASDLNLPIPKREKINRSFSFAEKNRIPYEIFKVNLDIPGALDESNFTISIEFPKLTNEQFQTLRKHFSDSSYVQWEQNRRYYLTDFLPPKIQAFLNTTVRQSYFDTQLPESFSSPRTKEDGSSELETGMACWDVVYEVIREGFANNAASPLNTHFFHLGAPIVDRIMKDIQYHDSRGFSQLSRKAIVDMENGFAERNHGRRFGDVFFLNTLLDRGQGATHVMMWIDDDLFFEKTDMGSEDPTRIVFYDDAMKFWLTENIVADQFLKANYVRYNKELPSPEHFADKGFLYNWKNDEYFEEPKDLLPAEWQKKLIWNMDVGLGSGMSKWRINPIYKVDLVITREGRAEFAYDRIPSETQVNHHLDNKRIKSCEGSIKPVNARTEHK